MGLVAKRRCSFRKWGILHMAPNLRPRLCVPLLFLLLSFLMNSNAELDHQVSHKVIAAPHKDVGTNVIDGTGVENAFNFENGNSVVGSRKGGSNKVSVSTVALFTLAMAAATGLGAVPFFFVELDPQWAGLCNGMAAGVMLAASFDLIQEGQEFGAGNWVVTGILAGGIFIWLCKKVMMFLPVSVSLLFYALLERIYSVLHFFSSAALCTIHGLFFNVARLESYIVDMDKLHIHNNFR